MASPKTQRGLYKCACGKVQCDVLVPHAGFGSVEPISILCSCRDCVGFAQAVIDASNTKYKDKSDVPNVEGKGIVTEGKGAVGIFVLYNSEVSLLQGEEHIKALKLSDKRSAPLRCYAACCGTPLGISEPFAFLYPSLIQPNPEKTEDEIDFAPFQPTVNFFIDSAPEGSAPPPEGCTAAKTATPGAVCKFLAKLSTSPFRTKPDNALVNTTCNIDPTIGIDTIVLEEE